jgi:hypothetical protein
MPISVPRASISRLVRILALPKLLELRVELALLRLQLS